LILYQSGQEASIIVAFFQNSRIYMCYTRRELTGILGGDNGYPCLPFLLTLILNPEMDEEIAYNNIHRRIRLIVERTFGIWKRRFPCLARGLTTKLICSTTIVVTCAVLHNLSLFYDNKLSDDEENEIDNVTSKPRRFCLYELEGKRRRRYGRTHSETSVEK